MKRYRVESTDCVKDGEQVFLYVETRKCYVHVICMLQRSKRDIFHISNVVAKTLRLNLLLIHEF